MRTITITVKGVDKKLFQELKAEAKRRKISVGLALTLAIKSWLSQKRTKEKISSLKSRDWDSKTERLVKE